LCCSVECAVGSQFTNSDRLFFTQLYRGEGIALHIGEQIIRASSPRGAISLRVSDHVRALAFGASQNPAESDIIVLAVPLEHATFVPHGLARCT
jgi:hypothetical protein